MMQKNFLTLLLMSIAFISCSEDKSILINELNEKNGSLLLEKEELLKKVNELENEIKTLKENDQFYWKSAIELFDDEKYASAIEKLNQLISRFPNSSYVSSSNSKIDEINKVQNKLVNEVIKPTSNENLEDAILTLKVFLDKDLSKNIREKATNHLSKLNIQFESIKKELEVLKKIGVRIENVKTGWEGSGLFQSEIFAPVIRMTVKNVSGRDIERLIIKADFVNPNTKEVFGDATSYVVGYGDTPLKSGYSKSVILSSGKGYTMLTTSLPQLNAEVYINDEMYKTISIKRF